jgi:hypothetical protein
MDSQADLMHFAFFNIFGIGDARLIAPSGAGNGRRLDESTRPAPGPVRPARHPASLDHLRPAGQGSFGVPALYAGLQALAG